MKIWISLELGFLRSVSESGVSSITLGKKNSSAWQGRKFVFYPFIPSLEDVYSLSLSSLIHVCFVFSLAFSISRSFRVSNAVLIDSHAFSRIMINLIEQLWFRDKINLMQKRDLIRYSLQVFFSVGALSFFIRPNIFCGTSGRHAVSIYLSTYLPVRKT